MPEPDGPAQHGDGGRILVEFQGNIAIIRLQRNQNRINLNFMKEFNEALDKVERHEEAQVLITTGENKYFSTGLDIPWILAKCAKQPLFFNDVIMREFNNLIARMLTFPMPTIAAINGHTFAGGAFISLSHDYRVMSHGPGIWCLNEIHVNVLITRSLIKVLRAKLTPQVVIEAANMGRQLSAEVAMNLGIVHRTCNPDQLIAVAKDVAKESISFKPFNRSTMQNMKTEIYVDVLQEIAKERLCTNPLMFTASKL